MKKGAILVGFCLFLIGSVSGQDQQEKKIRPISFYVGIQPAITVEPFDEYRNTADINLVPLIFEYAVNRHWSVRLNPVLNLQLRPEFPSAISHIGGGLTFPYHFSKKNSEEGHRGFYAGPNIAFTKHKVDNFNSATVSAEVGYAFIFNSVLSITVGVQGGTTMKFLPELGYNRIESHTGAIFSFGYWF